MKWIISILTFILTIIFIFAGNAIAQTDLNINNTNLFRLGGDVTIAENQVVENAHAIGGSVIIQPKGRVTQTASAIGGNVILKEEARIDGDAYAIGGKVQLAAGATIGGSKSTFDDRYDEGRMMGGYRHRDRFLPMYFLHASFRIFSAMIAAILGIILLQTTPAFLPNLAATVRQYPGRSGLWGIGTIVALIALIIFLAVTLIGIPLIPLLSLFVSLASLVGSLGISLFIGQEAMKSQDRSSLQQFLIGLLIITVLALIPFFGGIVVFMVSLFGLGTLIAWKLGSARPPVHG
jgi:hypothetical protein